MKIVALLICIAVLSDHVNASPPTLSRISKALKSATVGVVAAATIAATLFLQVSIPAMPTS